MNLHTVQNLLIRFIQSPLVTKIAQVGRSDARHCVEWEKNRRNQTGTFTSYTVTVPDCEVRHKRRPVPALPVEFALNQLKPAIPPKPANLMHLRPQTIPAAPPLPPVGGKRLTPIPEEVHTFLVDPEGLQRICSMPLPPLPERKVSEVKPKINLLSELHKALLNKKKPVTPKNTDFTKFAVIDLTNPVFTPPPEEFL